MIFGSLWHIYNLYVEYVVKIPLYIPGTPVRSKKALLTVLIKDIIDAKARIEMTSDSLHWHSGRLDTVPPIVLLPEPDIMGSVTSKTLADQDDYYFAIKITPGGGAVVLEESGIKEELDGDGQRKEGSGGGQESFFKNLN
ncbi:hypothetical protein QJS10_CPB20g02145 [Acorus calamus]|uniref:Uncharacterized protein n=1 Tax=Acorus calamus TaxID=4465 RepID=A0AAV9CB02_ACOCL|nr:hypothetical protein QJS10_CPB20g02145 [Acorus calamus]